MSVKKSPLKIKHDTNSTLILEWEERPTGKKKLLPQLRSLASNSWSQVAILSFAILIVRLWTLPEFAEARDSLFFVRGVQRYSVYELRPHWPGYPVYIWLGSFFRLFFTDPVQSLHLVSVVASTLTIWPIVAIARDWRLASGGKPAEADLAGLAAGFSWALVPLSWLGGSEIFSDPLALLLATTMLWM
jgi:hypothetical protein